MGCGVTKRERYEDSEYDEEMELRAFEIEMGAFRKSLNQVLPRICIEKDIINIANMEDFLLKDFSENFLKLIKHDFFYREHEGRKYYDAKKIKILLFLLSTDSTIYNGKIEYHDKASFIITHVKNNEEDDLNFPIQKTDNNFVQFINDMFEISCIGLVDAYIRLKNVKRDGYINKLRSFKDKTVDNVIDNLFFSKDTSASEGLTFKDLNKMFEEDKFLFTSGWIRETCWKALKSGINELEEKERQAEFEAAKNAKA
jgi:hypothetical protein